MAASKSLARAGYSNLTAGYTVGGLANKGGGNGSSGNPALKPLESKNFDLSAEWYFDDSSYASLGFFKKITSNDITNTPIQRQLFDILDPTQGTYVNQAVAALNGNTDAGAVRKWIGQNLAGSPGVVVDDPAFPNRVHIIGTPGVNPPMNFAINTPVNSTKDRDIHGFEAAVQYMFGESGFGASANYTSVVSDLDYDNANLVDQEAVIGLSDSYNLVGFYEANGISARLAYNWRDEFLAGRSNARGVGPTYTEAYGQFDLNVSYDLNDNMQVFLQGINITNEAYRLHVRDTPAALFYIENGARWIIGGTYKF
jgi:TonB-dependent receptor